ncbi:MAG TPA: orotate phosphoribosyltransferase [Gemmatales bacterium]|nr:orotate phosphoribosyltransferase [Gemmatales bacterium]
MSSRQILLELIRKRAIIHQEVTLASGQKSSYYIDARSLFLHGPSATLLGEAFYELTKDLPMDAIGGPAVGALPLTVATTMHYHRMGREMEGFFIRKEAKTHGLQKTVEGVLPAGGQVVVVEDVFTTGGSVMTAIDAVHADGARVLAVVGIVDRLQGARERFEKLDILFRTICTIEELGLAK